MTEKDIMNILNLLRGAYPEFYKSFTENDWKRCINTWWSIFCGYAYYSELYAACKEYIIFHPNPPKISDIIDILYRGKGKKEAPPVICDEKEEKTNETNNVISLQQDKEAARLAG